MCISPITVYVGPKGNVRPVQTACHECWQCVEQAVADWQGRNIAESLTAKACHAVTLTYGRDDKNSADHIRAALLTYSDVQKFLKLLRRHGFPVRYFVTGEYGSLWGRAHWHIILYWQERVPPGIVMEKNFMWARYDEATGEQAKDEKGNPAFFWPEGYAFFRPVKPHTVRYNCKYILKDANDELAQRKPAMSKLPPLGAAYFDQRARRYAVDGLAPQGAGPHEEWENGGLRIGGYEYTFPHVRRQNGELVRFRLRDKSLELFLTAYARHWRELHGDKPMPPSPLVEEFLDPGVWKAVGQKLQPDSAVLRGLERAEHKQHDFHVLAFRAWKRGARITDVADWRHEFDRSNGSGEERQRQAEERYRKWQDDGQHEARDGEQA